MKNHKLIFENWRRYLEEGYREQYPKLFYEIIDRFDENRKKFRALASAGDEMSFGLEIDNFFKSIENEYGRIFQKYGGFRAALFIDGARGGDYILKFAITPQGIKQNEQETYIGRNSKYSRFFPRVYEADEQFFWILSEQVLPVGHANTGLLPIDDNLKTVLRYWKEIPSSGYRYETEEIWRTMMWAIAELKKMGNINETSVENFFLNMEKGSNWGYERFEEFFLQTHFYEVGDVKRINGKHIPFANHERFQENREDLKEAFHRMALGFMQDAGWFTHQLINLAVELPDMEIWDLRPSNLGIRKTDDGRQIVILDSSFNISSEESF